MSRVGRMPVEIPEGVTVEVKPGNHVIVKGPKGQLEYTFNPKLTIKVEGNKAYVQVYEDTTGLKVGEEAIATGKPLVVELGPGLMGKITDAAIYLFVCYWEWIPCCI